MSTYDEHQANPRPCLRLSPPCGRRVTNPAHCHGAGCPFERFTAPCWRRVVGNSDEVSE